MIVFAGSTAATWSNAGAIYDPATNTFGGSNYYSAGVGPVNSFPTGTTFTPGVPNTGAGGNAAVNWTVLLASSLIAATGLVYMTRQRLSLRLR
jgi:hypothetical protein